MLMARAENSSLKRSVMADPFQQGQIDIVDRIQVQEAASAVRKRAFRGCDKLRVRVDRQVSYRIACTVRQRRRSRTDVDVAGRIDDDTVRGAIAVEIGIDGTLRRHVLARLVGIYRRDLPVSDEILHPPIAILEEWNIVDHLHHDAIAIVK